eukprot:m51a1_g14212 putative carbonic anhydrase 2 (556) ;mRNA; f:166582-169296
MMLTVFRSVLLLVVGAAVMRVTGPENWYRAFPYAAGRQQSPIDITTKNVAPLKALNALHFEWERSAVKVVNNGASVDVEIENPKENKMVDAYGVEYLLNGVHFHWHNTNNNLGSEHTVDGRAFALEAHFVHFKSSFATLAEAVAHNTTGDLSVVGVFFQVGKSVSALDSVLAVVPKLTSPNASHLVDAEAFDPKGLLPEHASTQYFHYKGSLTTPGCAEVVHWYVVEPIQQISQAQLGILRTALHDIEGKIAYNYRMTMPLNGRAVWTMDDFKGQASALQWASAAGPAVLLALRMLLWQQSPINIVTADAVSLASLQGLHFDWTHGAVEVVNNGASFEIEIENPKENKMVDAYGVEYLLNGVHFHWHNTNNNLGSEHTVDGRAFALEAHFVHFKSSFATLADAVAHNTTGDLSVVGVLFQVGQSAPVLDSILAVVPELTSPNSSHLVDAGEFDPEELLPEHASTQYYHYKGSLTTPGCAEVVHWYVVKPIQQISQAQLNTLRSAHHDSSGAMTFNFRSVMPLNGRTVWAVDKGQASSLQWAAGPVVILAALWSQW